MRIVHLCGAALLLSAVSFSACAPAAPVAQAPGAAAAPAGSLAGRASCPVQGTWELEAVTVDGQAVPPGQRWRQIKLVTASHYAWVGQEQGVPAAPLQSAADSLAAFRTRGFGGGTYQVTDSTYTERLEYFMWPDWIGREVTFSCRVVGDRWYHDTEYPIMEAGRETGRTRVEEVWRRIGTAAPAVREE